MRDYQNLIEETHDSMLAQWAVWKIPIRWCATHEASFSNRSSAKCCRAALVGITTECEPRKGHVTYERK